MAISEKKQKILIVALIVILLAIGVVVYLGFFRGVSIPTPSISPRGILPPPIEIESITPIEKQIESIKLNSSFLDSSLFKSLKIYGEIPIRIESMGRDNPFVPY